MLLPYSARLRAANVQIVLASLSPRRKELMGLLLPPAPSASSATAAAASSSSSSTPAVAAAPLPVPFSCVPSSFAEDLSHAAYPTAASYACATSLAKAREVWARVGSHSDLLIAADTVVTLDGKILEKPASHDGAFAMLRSLSGRSHVVATGVTLLVHKLVEEATIAAVAAAASSAAAPASAPVAASTSEPELIQFSVETEVTFADLSDDAIREYVRSNEPMDKAGGYGYQSLAATFVSSISGCYYNVVGFPLFEIATRIKPLLERILEHK